MRPLQLAVLAVALGGCGGPAIRGGTSVPAGSEPAGTVLHTFLPVRCQDASGGRVQWHTRLYLLRGADGRRVLVEARAGYDSLVLRDGFQDGSDLLFQVVVGHTLRELRVPATGQGAGSMAVATRWHERELADGGFRATPRDRILACVLDPGMDNAARSSNTPGP